MNASYGAKLSVTLVLASAGFLTGCQDTGPRNEKFFVRDDTDSVTAALDRQVANGARHDGMLRDQHFDGPRLNALGRAKLDRMMVNPGPVSVYLPSPTDAATADGRHEAILAYAKDHGRAASDLTFTDGVNPATVHLAAPHLSRLPKTELGNMEQSGAPADPTASGAGDRGLSGNNTPALPGSTPNRTGG